VLSCGGFRVINAKQPHFVAVPSGQLLASWLCCTCNTGSPRSNPRSHRICFLALLVSHSNHWKSLVLIRMLPGLNHPDMPPSLHHSTTGHERLPSLVCLDHTQMVKYGVISTKSVLDDLRTWRHLYVAGRLQKPVLMLVSKVEELEGAQAANLQAAAAAALLLLPTHFTTSVRLPAGYTASIHWPFNIR